jgi:hypothetical protein
MVNPYPQYPRFCCTVAARSGTAYHFIFGRLIVYLRNRSFDTITLLLGVVAIAAGASIVGGLLLFIPRSS